MHLRVPLALNPRGKLVHTLVPKSGSRLVQRASVRMLHSVRISTRLGKLALAAYPLRVPTAAQRTTLERVNVGT